MERIRFDRVYPRDFFNEAKLLKCFGQVSLNIEDCKTDLLFLNPTRTANIILYNDGYLGFDHPFFWTKERKPLVMRTVYNSKSTYPIYYYDTDTNEEIPVLTEQGEFTNEFINQIKNK